MGVREKGNADYEKDFSNLEEVVRCENCTWNERNIDGVNDHWCTYFGKDIEDNTYCSYGEAVE